jgi:deazaflavin-dependent oxidoreductase (nitroreductase family)
VQANAEALAACARLLGSSCGEMRMRVGQGVVKLEAGVLTDEGVRTMRAIDRLMRGALRIGIGRRSTALLETTGRRSKQPRITPVTNGLDGTKFWIVTEHGMRSNYVRNLLADPRVRVKADGRWKSGVAHVVSEDAQARLEKIAKINPCATANTDIVRKSATDLQVIRVDLDE